MKVIAYFLQYVLAWMVFLANYGSRMPKEAIDLLENHLFTKIGEWPNSHIRLGARAIRRWRKIQQK